MAVTYAQLVLPHLPTLMESFKPKVVVEGMERIGPFNFQVQVDAYEVCVFLGGKDSDVSRCRRAYERKGWTPWCYGAEEVAPFRPLSIFAKELDAQ